MSDEVGIRELLPALERRRNEIGNELGMVQELESKHDAERRRLTLARKQALEAAAVAMLPGLTQEQRTRAVRLSGFTPLVNEDAQGALEAERQALAARLAEIEADPRYRDRELLRAERVGTLTRQIAELDEFRAPLAEVVARAEHPRLDLLLQVGYGTESYRVGWWRLSYYSDWKAGDEILARFPGQNNKTKSFAEVREELLSARDSLAVYDAKLGALRAEVAAGEALEKEAMDKRTALETVAERHLGAWRARLREHLANTDPQALGDRLAGEPDLALLLTQGWGLERKLAYLDEIVAKQVTGHREALQRELQKVSREIVKLHRPKNAYVRMPRDQFQQRFHDRPTKLRRNWQRTRDSYQTVNVFNQWDRGSLVQDFLWWDVMTDGRLDGDFIPEVSRFHQVHPDWQPPRGSADDERAAAAATVEHDTTPAMLVDAS